MDKIQVEIDVRIERLVYGGDAMGRMPDGKAMFVPYALPGELVRTRVVDEKKGHVKAEMLEVIEASPERIKPRCMHFGICGGCHYQHLPYESQLVLKTEILREQLQRIAGIQDPPIRPMIPSEMPWNYRNTVQFHLSPQGKLGYLEMGSQRVVEIQECHLPEQALNEVWPQLALEPIPGLERVEMRLSADEEVLLAFEGSDPTPPEFEVDIPISAVHVGPAGTTIMAGDNFLVMEILGRAFSVSAGSFFQINTRQAEAMVQYLLSHLPLTSETTLLDVFCGVGLFSAFTAPKVRRCIGVELAPTACRDFAMNLDEYDNVELYAGAAEAILPLLKVLPDVVIIDPPRCGLEKPALDALVNMHAGYLAYVSCDPATLARDTKRFLKTGYRLLEIQPFDLFPQTYHIESISLFRL